MQKGNMPDGMKDGEYCSLGVVPMVVFDRTVELAIPRTSTLRLRKGKEDAPAREHLAAVARNGFMAGETMRREERRKIGYLRTCLMRRSRC